ncbi:hypothetical protein IMG5_011720, partial [Ichthyophthirius multifiliis]
MQEIEYNLTSQSDEDDEKKQQSQDLLREMNHRQYNFNMYLTKITEEQDSEKIIYCLREQNSKLASELKFLNFKLNEILTKQNKKKFVKKSLDQNFNDIQTVQKELNNAYKKIEIYQKENKQLQSKIDNNSLQKVLHLECQLKEKDIQIQKQQEEIKTLQQQNRNLNKIPEQIPKEKQHI